MGEDEGLTPNQLVAYNLRRARELRHWTQDEAAERLESFIGTRWSKGTFSAAERSIVGTRVRQFTADDLIAFSLAFDLPLAWWLLPPEEDPKRITIPGLTQDGPAPASALLTLLLAVLEEPVVERASKAMRSIPQDQRTRVQALAHEATNALVAAAMVDSLDVFGNYDKQLRKTATMLTNLAETMAAMRSSAAKYFEEQVGQRAESKGAR